MATAEWKIAHHVAWKLMTALEDKGVIQFDDSTEEQLAKAMLKEAFKLALGPSPHQTKLAAARLVLEYTKAKPASKADLTIMNHEAWLDAVAKDADSSSD